MNDILDHLREVRDTLEDGPEYDALNGAMHEISELRAMYDELAKTARELSTHYSMTEGVVAPSHIKALDKALLKRAD